MNALIAWFKRQLRRMIQEPSYCRNCRAMSFKKVLLDGRWERWVCESCQYVHAPTIGGMWGVRSPEESRVDTTEIENL